jgi:hypothetical protein
MISWLLLALLSAPLPAQACKPFAKQNCEEKSLIPLHSASFESLSGKVTAFQKELTAFLLKAPPPQSRSSCFNNNFAVFFISRARESAPKHDGKICSDLIQQIKTGTEALINADSLEWKTVKGKTEQAKLSLLAKDVRSALEDFLHHH